MNNNIIVHSARYETRDECFEQEILPALNERFMWMSELPTEQSWGEFLDVLSGMCVSYVTNGVPADYGWDGEEAEGSARPGFYVTVSSDDFWNETIHRALGEVTLYELWWDDTDRPHSPLKHDCYSDLEEARSVYYQVLPRVTAGQDLLLEEVDGRGSALRTVLQHSVPLA